MESYWWGQPLVFWAAPPLGFVWLWLHCGKLFPFLLESEVSGVSWRDLGNVRPGHLEGLCTWFCLQCLAVPSSVLRLVSGSVLARALRCRLVFAVAARKGGALAMLPAVVGPCGVPLRWGRVREDGWRELRSAPVGLWGTRAWAGEETCCVVTFTAAADPTAALTQPPQRPPTSQGSVAPLERAISPIPTSWSAVLWKSSFPRRPLWSSWGSDPSGRCAGCFLPSLTCGFPGKVLACQASRLPSGKVSFCVAFSLWRIFLGFGLCTVSHFHILTLCYLYLVLKASSSCFWIVLLCPPADKCPQGALRSPGGFSISDQQPQLSWEWVEGGRNQNLGAGGCSCSSSARVEMGVYSDVCVSVDMVFLIFPYFLNVVNDNALNRNRAWLTWWRGWPLWSRWGQCAHLWVWCCPQSVSHGPVVLLSHDLTCWSLRTS